MLGSALKLGVNSDVLDQNETSFLFPKGTWCDIYIPENKCYVNNDDNSASEMLPSKAYDFHLHLRGGFIVPMQDAIGLEVSTTHDLQLKPVDFHILIDENNRASGDYINDDGVTTKDSGVNKYSISSYKDADLVFMIDFYQAAEDYIDK